MEDAFRILASSFMVLLGSLEKRTKVARDIVVTCVVLHNMLKTHQGEAVRAPIP